MEKYIGFGDIEVLYPETVLNFLCNFSSLSTKSFGFSMNTIISSISNAESFLFLSNSYDFISFSLSYVLVRTLFTMLNSSGHQGHPCFVSDLQDKFLNIL